jgi:hypothetical protein
MRYYDETNFYTYLENTLDTLDQSLDEKVLKIVHDVKSNQDKALIYYSKTPTLNMLIKELKKA